MKNFVKFAQGEPVISAFIGAPLVIFSILLVAARLDTALLPNVAIQHYIHYYMAAFSGFVALIIALYSSGVFGQQIRVRMQFITMAFSMLAALLLVSGLTTPGILLADVAPHVSAWSFLLSLPVSALFFVLAGIRWSPRLEARLARGMVWLWVGVIVALALYLWWITAVPQSTIILSRSLPGRVIGLAVALLTIAAFAWAAARVVVDFEALYTFSHRLSGTLLLLAEAQFFLVVGRANGLTGIFVYPLLLLALLVAVWAILSSLRNTENLQVSRYFAAAGSVLIVGMSLLMGEFVISVLDLKEHRLAILFALLFQSVLGFLVLYVIVVHLDRLVQLRTEELRREQRLRTELTQMVIHDLKSPLSVIRSSIGMLLKEYLGKITPRQQRVLVRADESSQRILQLINNLLDVERLEAGALPIYKRDIEGATWLREALAHWEVVAEAQNKRLLIHVPDGLPPLLGDRELLQRVITNLLTNAFNYSMPEGFVEVTAVAKDQHVIILVSDDGPGVPDSDKQRIFEKFAQVESIHHRGTGLGLTFCRMVVEAHNGDLSVEDNPNGGAIFRLALPVHVRDAAPAGQDPDLPAAHTRRPTALAADTSLSSDKR